MKQLAICISFLIATASHAQSTASGQLKISIESFRCINKSWDGFVEFDGHGNEVSVNFSYRVYSPANPAAARAGSGGSVIFGSNVNGMTRAGSQTPDLGGIANGDVVNVNLPLMDLHVNADEYIIIAPTVWEWDGPEKNTLNRFNAQLEADLNFAVSQPFPFANTRVSYYDPLAGRISKIFDKYNYGQAIKYHNVFKEFICPGNTQGNRVIGIRSGVFNNECLVTYPPTLLLLDTRVLYALYYNKTPATTHAEKESRGPVINDITIPFVENTYGVTTSNGSYTVKLKIDFVPDANPQVITSNNNNNTYLTKPVKIATTIKKEAPNQTLSALLPGKWIGTQTNEQGLNPQEFVFELTDRGEYIVKDNRGNLSASGNYSFSNNIFTGSFRILRTGEVFSFTGTLDRTGSSLSGSLGSGTETKGRGLWAVKKQL